MIPSSAGSAIRSPWPSLAPYPRHPVWALLQNAALRFPDTPALITDNDVGQTYSGLWQGSRAVAGYLRTQHRIGKGSIVAVGATNDGSFVASMFGALLLGAAVSPMNCALRQQDALHQLTTVQPDLVIAPNPLRRVVEQLLREGALGPTVHTLSSEDIARISQEQWPEAEPAAIHADRDLAMIPFSSGTSGLPKGITLTHANVLAATIQGVSTDSLDPSSRVLNLRLFWTRLLLSLATGATCISQDAHDPEKTLWLLEHHGVTHLLIRPWLLQDLAHAQRLRPRALPSLRVTETGAEALSPSLAREAARLLGCPVHQAYHLMETCGSANRAPLGESAGASVGWPVPDTEERIVDPASLRDVEPGQTGELLIRGPQVTSGYWNEPMATSVALLDNGWLRTGDIARQDKRERVVVVDRMKDMFKVWGRPVSPAEVEAVLLEHPEVRCAAVVGAPAPEGGEMPKAYIVPRDGAAVTEIELLLLVSQRLAPHKHPRAFEFVESLPTNAAGKTLRRALGAQEIFSEGHSGASSLERVVNGTLSGD
jgi:acyl-CoA synthetase (AMP-forming)/AMP-acid ligase II